ASLIVLNTRFEDHGRSAIGPRTDETAETLFEPHHRLRDAVFEERISTAPLNRLHTSLHYRFLRHAEGEFRNDDIFERLTGDVHPFPKTVGGKQHAGLVLLEDLRQPVSRRVALHQGTNPFSF